MKVKVIVVILVKESKGQLTHNGIIAGKLNGVTPAHTPKGSR